MTTLGKAWLRNQALTLAHGTMLNLLNFKEKLALESSTPALQSPGLKGQDLKWRIQVQSGGALVPAQVCNGLVDSFAALASPKKSQPTTSLQASH